MDKISVRVIKDGNTGRQGNAKCPKCNEVVLIERCYGDLPDCPHCKVAYVPRRTKPKCNWY